MEFLRIYFNNGQSMFLSDVYSFTNSCNAISILIEKWERLNELLSEHLLFVTSFLTHDFSNRHNWETQKFTFTCLSLKILKNLNRLMEDLAFAHLENQILEKIISSRRNLLRACNKLLFDLGSFQEVVIYLLKCTLKIN